MKALLQEFWVNPVKKRWFIIGNFVLFALFYLAYYLLDKHISPLLSLGLIFLALMFELTAAAFYAPSQLKEIWQDLLSIVSWANRDALYHHYQIKNKDKGYKGPDWNDEEFTKIENLEQRVDAFVKASINFQKTDFEKWKKQNIGKNLDHSSETQFRISLVILAAVCSFLILCISGWLRFLDTDVLITSNIDNKAFYTIPAALIGTIIAAPIIFVIWYFRDRNSRIQIENARKDTNLKDFQKLSEWASGFHLPELKRTQNIKHSKKFKNGSLDEYSEDETTSIEDSLAPENTDSISRRQGAEALQASAISQLEAFMFGKYGEQFMQPAFLLIHAIWESIIALQQQKFVDDESFERSLTNLYKKPIVSALNKALGGEEGYHLQLFEHNLEGLNLTGLNTNHPPLKGLRLIGNNLQGVNFNNANLEYCLLQGANLRSSKLENSNLMNANLQGSNLRRAKLNYADLSDANLQGANLNYAKLEYAEMAYANLENTNLRFARLNNANLANCNLSKSDLRGTQLIEVHLYDAIVKDCKINKRTLIGYYADSDDSELHYVEHNIDREAILARGAIWDDDPEWLVGKIKDETLLEKIRQDCAERAKQKGA